MTSVPAGRRKPPNLAIRAVLMLLASAVVSAFGLAVVDLVTRPTPEAGGGVHRESGEEEMPRDPHVREALGEFAVQLLLVSGIALAGRRILKMRL